VSRFVESSSLTWRRPRPGAALERLRAVVLLGGSIRPTSFHTTVGRSVLDLPVDEEGTVLDHWRREVDALAAAQRGARLEMKIMIDHLAHAPASGAGREGAIVSIERDPFAFRGTGGLLHDLARRWDDNDLLLVASAGQLLLEPLIDLAYALASRSTDVAVVAHRGGTPSGLMLVRCGCLRMIPKVGFVDMKEQALPRIAQHHEVAVVDFNRPTGLPLRTLAGYIDALRARHQRVNDAEQAAENDWRATFFLVEPRAIVAPTAMIHDAVVLSGARVESDATVVRSVICPGAVVRAGAMVVDDIVSASS